MDRYVVDASVAVSLVLPDEPFQKAASMLFTRFAKRELALMTVPLLIFEVANALWKAVRLGRIALEASQDALEQIEELRIPLRNPPAIRILELAHKYGRTAYDAAYLALALREDVPLVTADRRLFNALQGSCELIRWIEEVE